MTTQPTPEQQHAPGANAPQPKDRVLSTLNQDGTRRWLRPRLSLGRFLLRRRIVAWALIAVFTLIPYLRMNGKPIILLDIVHREFTFFGATFLPTDTLLLALFIVSVFVTIFLITALFGRVWCGWACPQTVYMEFLFRPIERFFEGGPGHKAKMKGPLGLRKALKFATYLLASMFLAHTFLAYFVGVEQLYRWVQGSPFNHPIAFLVMAGVTGAMLFDFGFFREQLCIVACPYGRFQSVMLDRNSLIISYDPARGEPRGKLRRSPKRGADVSLKVVTEEPKQGDCIDCHMCVTTCPTGIDIREGLQMECIGCAQCIDACDAVMDKIGRPRGLIRYSSQSAIEGEKPRILRPRVIFYPLILTILLTVFAITLAGRQPTDITILRGLGAPFATLETGEIANLVRVKVVNRTLEPSDFTIRAEGVEGAHLIPAEDAAFTLAAGETITRSLQVVVPPNAFERGAAMIDLRITSDDGFEEIRRWRLLGPGRMTRPAAEPRQESDQ
ncbi:MAG: cytochrome c oxidase accessory protein CcoG [Planctomycetota bacterium]|nr:cytochrome c oxidase accessory protein CcoG [Planctomycetota bacterium]